ncbi:hypothetical protein [Streptomyces sp. NPDC050704]|uniref:hypothetical protein n=1 Tax=Streptomyces sp. NPDC050704 TaxID=3157219 RepID=UPI00343C6BF4
MAPVLDRRAHPEPVTHHTWDGGWVTVRCAACGRADQWPRPELGCSCGTVLRIPVVNAGTEAALGAGPHTDAHIAGAAADPDEDQDENDGFKTRAGSHNKPNSDADAGLTTETGADDGPSSGHEPDTGPGDGPEANPGGESEAPRTDTGTGTGTGTQHPTPAPPPTSPHGSGRPARIPLPRTAPAPRPAFQPVAIRTARDAVTAAALYLRWLGYRDIRRADQRPPSGIGLAARGIVAQVDPTVRPASLRDVECLWLTAMTESAGCVYFSLAGYDEDARSRADSLGVPLFVLDLTGTPQPVNSLADELIATGA